MKTWRNLAHGGKWLRNTGIQYITHTIIPIPCKFSLLLLFPFPMVSVYSHFDPCLGRLKIFSAWFLCITVEFVLNLCTSLCAFSAHACLNSLPVYCGLRVGMWGWPWAGRLLAASWRVLSVGAAGACLAWWGGRKGRTGEKREWWETQNLKKNHTKIRTWLKHMHIQNHSHNKCSHGNIQICQIFDLPNANNKF